MVNEPLNEHLQIHIDVYYNSINFTKFEIEYKITAYNITISKTTILDSERSDECIDFTMMCAFFYFFVSIITFLVKVLRFSSIVTFLIGK